jgi:multidrug efflux pump subunit AcrB
VLATTFSLVAVFVPVAFMSGMVGQFFKQFGLTMTAAVMLSLWVAFTLDPMLSARLTRRFKPGEHHVRRGLAGLITRILDGIDNLYQLILDQALKHPILVTLGAIVSFVVAIGLGATIPTEMIPKPDRGEVQADIDLPIGSSLALTDAAAIRAEARLAKIPGVYRVYTVVGLEQHPNRARFRVKTVDKEQRPHPLSWYEDQVRLALEAEATAQVTLMMPAVIEGLGDWPPMMVILQGDSLDTLLTEGRRLKKMMEETEGSSDVRISVNPGVPELQVEIDRAIAADRGIPAGLVGITARTLMEGQLIGTLRDGGPEADIRVRAAPRFSKDAAAIAQLPLSTPRGTIPLGDVAKISMGAGPSEIQHYNRMRAVTVSTQVANGATLGTVQEEFFKKLEAAPLADGYFYTLDGQVRDMNETASAMGLAVAVAAIFIFMVLASQFESLLHPFTLMASLPLALVGAILALLLTGNSISMGAQIGIVLLMGLVTKNAILLVDGALTAMRGGLSPADAMRIAGPRRLRPILMTTAAMVLGMIPTAINQGVGAEFRAPMAITVIGGVLSSTVLTLLVVPVAFVLMESFHSALLWIWRKFNPPEEEEESPQEVTETTDAGSDAAK